MEAPEVPLEQTQEHINENAHHSKIHWVLGVALTSALLAASAAVASLLAGHHANEAMIDQMRASDQWAYYQAKGIKAGMLTSRIEILKAVGKAPAPDDEKKAEQYIEDQKEIKEKADELEKGSDSHVRTHIVFARSVTMFQVAIAISAISVLTKRKRFWYVGIGFGAVGAVFFVLGLLTH